MPFRIGIIGLGQRIIVAKSKMKATIQIIIGFAVTTIISVLFLYARFSFFWEIRYPDGSSPITWRSGLAFLLFLTMGQLAGFFIVRRIGKTLNRRTMTRSRGEE